MHLQLISGIGIGLVVGAFIPSVLRKIKALFVKEGDTVKAAVVSELKKAEADVKSKL